METSQVTNMSMSHRVEDGRSIRKGSSHEVEHVTVQNAREWKGVESKRTVPMVVRSKRDDVQGSPSLTSLPSLGATPTARSHDNLIPTALLNVSQGISHLQATNTA